MRVKQQRKSTPNHHNQQQQIYNENTIDTIINMLTG